MKIIPGVGEALRGKKCHKSEAFLRMHLTFRLLLEGGAPYNKERGGKNHPKMLLSVFYIFLILNPSAIFGADDIFTQVTQDRDRPNPHSGGTSIHHRNLHVRIIRALSFFLFFCFACDVCECVCARSVP